MSCKYFLLTAFLLFGSLSSFSQNFPEKANQLVNDYTNTLSADEANQLEQKLELFNDSTSTQIAVVVIQSLDGDDVNDYAVRLAEKWGIGGSKKKSNGVLLLASIGDRKVTIQTGYGVEGVLPDAIAKRIIENEIVPHFKNGNYFAGLDAGTNAIISYTKGEYKADHKDNGWEGNGIIFFIVFLLFIIIMLFGRGGGGNRIIGSRGSTGFLLGTLMGSGFGGSGGGRSSGGFSGFGGGSFGGGGASGSW